LLLIPNPEWIAKVQAVRERLDPLSPAVPPHITLLDPLPRERLQSNFLKNLNLDVLPKIDELRFDTIIIHEERCLWLMPAAESRDKILEWRAAALQGVPPPHASAGLEEYVPHFTLGYLSRELSADDTMQFVREKLLTPLKMVFDKLLFEEFGDNQVSIPIDTRRL
jgi:hypothetical protein